MSYLPPPADPEGDAEVPYSTWVEWALMEAWADYEPSPEVLRAQDAAPGQPALIDFTILDLRVGLQVWRNAVSGFISHRHEARDGFGGYEFHEVAQLPLNRELTLDEFVETLCTRYDEIAGNLPAVAQHPSAALPQWQLFASVALFAVLVPAAIVALVALISALPYILDPGFIHRTLFGGD